MLISMIAAMSENRTIGKDNQVPWHLPADFAWFRHCTMGKPVIMGRKTFDSIGRPLAGRNNVVISRNRMLNISGVLTVISIEGALASVANFNEVMIIGGASIYQACLPKAGRLYLTYVESSINGDIQFPNLGYGWHMIYQKYHQADVKNMYSMRFVVLERQI
ncbi:dihydrofolate reductase type 3 [Candidatus Photodesmus blepharus]|uniref:Dihydrofolate reductase n=1 Tax=Candidatus Photodesmus blepharonis TaxID=1179155 RepID=A0A084CM18_9GAMM|nr:type 3 dihydrofolate reductase [Candidatus Photodesmus blepharus]KEY90847.1 dihydrofolate reductase type 3 [Candidatus Photodesmus blepharus]